MGEKTKITKAAGLMSVATLMSRVLGYIKDMILAGYFGAGSSSDVFFVAFRIPNLLRELFAEGSMSSAFVPVLTQYQVRYGTEEANRLVRSVFFFVLFFVGAICAVGIVLTPLVVSLIAPGFPQDSPKFMSAVMLTKIMFPFLLFISLASVVMGALNTRGVFFIPAIAPAALNVVTIASILALASQFTEPIMAVAIGVTAGGLVQLLIQVPVFFKKGFSLKSKGESQAGGKAGAFRHPGLREIGLLIIPSTIGLAANQINIFVSTVLASFLDEGSITYLYYSMRLIQFPIGIFGVAMGMAALPSLAAHASRGDMGQLKEDFSFSLRLLFFMAIPAMVGLIILNEPIVSTLFQNGRFIYKDTVNTAEALTYYAAGIWAIVGVRMVTTAFYSMKDTKTPVYIASCGVLINIIASMALMGPFRHSGLAMANSIAAGFNFALLFYLLRRKIGPLGTKEILSSFLKAIVAAALMGITGWLVSKGSLWVLDGHMSQKALRLSLTIFACIFVYGGSSYFLKSAEMMYIIGKLTKSQRISDG